MMIVDGEEDITLDSKNTKKPDVDYLFYLSELAFAVELETSKISQTHRSVGLEWSLLGEDPLPIDFLSTMKRLQDGDKHDFRQLIGSLESKMEGLVGLDPQEQLLEILQTLPKEEIERIPDGAGSITKLRGNEQHRKRGSFVSYRRKSDPSVTDRIWRFFPINDHPISNKTEIVSQIQYDESWEAEPRIDERNLQTLRESRLRIEQEFATIAAGGRTIRVTGSIRKAFELAKKKGVLILTIFYRRIAENLASKGS